MNLHPVSESPWHSELKFNYWYAPLNLHPGSESPLDIQSANSIADMLLWTCIQYVSHPRHSELKFNCWHAAVDLHPVSESPWTFRAQIQLLTYCCELHLESESPWTFRAQIQLLICYCELASSLWVTLDIQSSTSIADMLLWTCIQSVSHPGHSELKFNCWHAAVNLYAVSESPWTFRAQIQLLTYCCKLHLESKSPWTFRAQI